jgi:hypothetical protein
MGVKFIRGIDFLYQTVVKVGFGTIVIYNRKKSKLAWMKGVIFSLTLLMAVASAELESEKDTMLGLFTG